MSLKICLNFWLPTYLPHTPLYKNSKPARVHDQQVFSCHDFGNVSSKCILKLAKDGKKQSCPVPANSGYNQQKKISPALLHMIWWVFSLDMSYIYEFHDYGLTCFLHTHARTRASTHTAVHIKLSIICLLHDSLILLLSTFFLL